MSYIMVPADFADERRNELRDQRKSAKSAGENIQ